MNRKTQKGQATAEMAYSLIAVMSVISGFLIVSQIGLANIETLLEAKANADINSVNGIPGSPGSSIRYWDIGDDNLEYSNDDDAQSLTSDNAPLFNNELGNPNFSLASDLGTYVQDNFARDLGQSYVFLPAANLTSASEVTTINLNDASRFLYGGNTLFGLKSVNVGNTVYMPIISGD